LTAELMVALRGSNHYIVTAGLRGALDKYSRGLTILKGAVPGRTRGSGHMAPTYFCRFPGSKSDGFCGSALIAHAPRYPRRRMNPLDGIAIRPLDPHDSIEGLTALLHRAYAPLGAMGLNYTAVDQTPSDTRSRIGKGICFVAVDGGGRLVGTVLFQPSLTAADTGSSNTRNGAASVTAA
jgi:hypothetical protein